MQAYILFIIMFCDYLSPYRRPYLVLSLTEMITSDAAPFRCSPFSLHDFNSCFVALCSTRKHVWRIVILIWMTCSPWATGLAKSSGTTAVFRLTAWGKFGSDCDSCQGKGRHTKFHLWPGTYYGLGVGAPNVYVHCIPSSLCLRVAKVTRPFKPFSNSSSARKRITCAKAVLKSSSNSITDILPMKYVFMAKLTPRSKWNVTRIRRSENGVMVCQWNLL